MAFNFEVHFGVATRSNFKDLLFWQKVGHLIGLFWIVQKIVVFFDFQFLLGKKKRDIDMKALTEESDVFVRKDDGYTRKHFYRILEDHITK